jgi:hypothetical protein
MSHQPLVYNSEAHKPESSTSPTVACCCLAQSRLPCCLATTASISPIMAIHALPCISVTLDVHSGGTGFKSWSRHQLSLVKVLILYLSTSSHLRDNTSIRPRPPPSKSFSVHYSPVIPTLEAAVRMLVAQWNNPKEWKSEWRLMPSLALRVLLARTGSTGTRDAKGIMET